ncbi:hypothetical protein [Pseudomonas aeruginosa]|uniref:hypothetical protein n=1 Tax=Pseudomonas aeruginosa TaxID=287 RepID=UPI002E365430|nr:hypothetical protein [Pseudomonas aeruginosa]
MVWGDIRTARGTDKLAPFDYPTLTFSNNAANPSTWSGLAALAEICEREAASSPTPATSSGNSARSSAAPSAKRKLEDERLAREKAERIHAERLAYVAPG